MTQQIAERRTRRTTVMVGVFSGLLLVGTSARASLNAQQPTTQQPVVQKPVATRDEHDAIQATRAAQELLARPVTLTLSRVTLKAAIDSVASVAHVLIQYRLPLLTRHTAPVSLQASHLALGVVLERLLDGTAISVIATAQGHVMLTPAPGITTDSVPTNSVGSVNGRVVDSATGRPIHGVTVNVSGTRLTAVTSDSGRFVLRNVPVGEQAVTVRFFGYRPVNKVVTITSDEPAVVRVTLVTVPSVLSGVVTTATGMQRKIEIGNDITAINVDSVMRIAPITSVTDLLETRVPGLTVLHSSGVPGDPSRIRLRGVSSISENNDPIVIVDGVRVYASQSDDRNRNLATSLTGGTDLAVKSNGYAAPSPLDQIDPNSIATIEVFKGPSASALYGSDAANGVIVITTKHGVAGPAHWTMDLGAGINYQPGQWPVNYYRFGYGQSSGIEGSPFCDWNDLSCTVDSIIPFQALNDPQYTVFASHGSDQTASLSVSGGAPAVTYSLTGTVEGITGLFKLPGIEQVRYQNFYGATPPNWMLRPDHYTTNSVQGQLNAQPASNISVTVTSSLFTGQQQRSSLEGSIAQLEGTYILPAQLGQSPLIINEAERATDHQVTQTNALRLEWKPMSWLPLLATAGVNTIQRRDETLIPYGINSCSEGGVNGTTNCGATDTTGFFGLGRGTSQDNTMNVGTTIPLPRVALAMGINFHSVSTSDVTASTNQLSPGVTEPTEFPTTNLASNFGQSTSAASTYGFYIQPQIHVLGDFYLNPGFRTDGGSATGSNAGLLALPKIDLSYAVVNRPDHPLWGALTLLRPRVAFGYAGVQPAPTDRLRLFNTGNGIPTVVSLDGTTTVPVVTLNSLGNTQLRPERSREVEGGFDASFWDDRIQTTITRYSKTRHDAIIGIPVPGSVYGANGEIQKNIGTVQNDGTEITFNALPIVSRALSWNIAVNLSNDNNRVIRLNPGEESLSSSEETTRIVVGYPLFSRWALPIVAYADANHDGVIEANEVRVGDSAIYVGQQDPKYQWTLNTGVAMDGGRFSVNATFAYQNGLTQFNAAGGSGFANLPNGPGTTLATQAAVVAATRNNIASARSTDIGLIQTVNIFRFQAMSVNYTLPAPVALMFRVPRMVVSVQGSNLGLHSNYRGKDPQVNAWSTGGSSTEDSGQLPLPRTWWLKLSMGN